MKGRNFTSVTYAMDEIKQNKRVESFEPINNGLKAYSHNPTMTMIA